MPGTAGRVISNLVNRAKGLDEIHDDVQTLDGIVDVPAKDATADVQMSDVVGKKDDTAVAAVGTTKSLVAYVKGIMNDLSNGTDGLGALKTSIGTVDDLHDVPTKDAVTDAQMRDVVGKKDDTAVTTVATTKSLTAYLKGALNQIATVITNSYARQQVKVISVTAAANAGADTTLGTVATQAVIVEGVVIHADAPQSAHLTTCPVQGGTAKAVTFIGTGDATQANLDATNKQLGWTGEVYLPVGATIVMTHNGSGADALNLTVSLKYRAAVSGGTLS